jgi:hypothetical protein
VSWPPPKVFLTRHTSGITLRTRHLHVTEVPEGYPYHVSHSGDKFSIPFFEIRGQGPPQNYDPDFGSPGDIYLDLQNYAVYLKSMTGWVRWHAAVTSSLGHKPLISDLSGHPYLVGWDMFLWCDGRLLGWWSRKTIMKKRRQMHDDGLYDREDGITDESHAIYVVARIVKKMLDSDAQEKGKWKRGTRFIKWMDDDAGRVHKKMKTSPQTLHRRMPSPRLLHQEFYLKQMKG